MDNKIVTTYLFGIATSIAFLGNGLCVQASEFDKPSETPNIVIVFTDDQGYADVGCFGSTDIDTPHLDKLADEGMRFTSFYVAQSVCGASRAALLTGCYPNRIGLLGAPSHATQTGIHEREMTIAELVKQKDYATAIFGKWHLGHHEPFLPTNHGFDEYYGLPYSNDMWPFHPTNDSFPALPMYEGTEIVDDNVTADDQTHLTKDYTERAVSFIREHQDRPFFLYLAHSMPHVPLFGQPEFEGSSRQGRYGDIIQEIDWGVGQVVATLEELDIRDNTLVIFTSDNGPWLSYGDHAGSAGSLREGKGTAWEGGMREPCIMSWPNVIPMGHECDELAVTIDLFPTIAKIIDADLPEHTIDGKNILPLMRGEEGAETPHDAFFYYYGRGLRAVRSGDWKLVFPHQYRSLESEPGSGGIPSRYIQRRCGLELYHLAEDISEQNDRSAEFPEIVESLSNLADGIRQELGDQLQQVEGSQLRPPGRVRSENERR